MPSANRYHFDHLCYFLKIDGIEGETEGPKHNKEIEVLCFSWHEAVAADLGAGGAETGDFHFTMRMNKASPKLLLACATGQRFPKAVLTICIAGGKQEDYMKFALENCFVTSYKTGLEHLAAEGPDGAEAKPGEHCVLADHVSMFFERVHEEYRPQKKDGSLAAPVMAGWDRARRAAM